MVCTADDLQGWKDFPKGLRVLLLDEDTDSASEIRSRLEKMDYIVFTFCNENEALTAISNRTECFHVAIVEVSTGNSNGSFKFLESAKDLPTIMTSNSHCLSTMMKCIALGAAEFLQKPLSEDKLNNIWQHVVHKAFNAGETGISKSLKPAKDTTVSRPQLQVETMNPENENLLEAEGEAQAHKLDNEQSAASDRFQAPSTPQLKHGGRLLDDGDCQDQPNCSMEKEPGDQEEDSKSVDITCGNLAEETTSKVDLVPRAEGVGLKEEDDSPDGSNSGSNISSHRNDKDRVGDARVENGSSKKTSILPSFCGNRVNKKKTKVDWTPELHKRFVQAVEQLGVDQAIPSRILDLMKVEGLTRHNVASHLQKYRIHRRHIVPKEDDRRWHHPRETIQRVYAQKPVMAFPPYHLNHGFSTSQIYPVWGHPSSHQMYGHPGFPSWWPPESWPWKTYPRMHADMWGCPAMPTPQVPWSPFPQNPPGFHSSDTGQEPGSMQRVPSELYPAEDEVDRVVKEAISKPWLPLPLGLKPPSTESVLSELHRNGISNIPPYTTSNISNRNKSQRK